MKTLLSTGEVNPFGTSQEAEMMMTLAIGRLLKLMAGPPRPDDREQYEEARRMVFICGDALSITPTPTPSHRPGRNFGDRFD